MHGSRLGLLLLALALYLPAVAAGVVADAAAGEPGIGQPGTGDKNEKARAVEADRQKIAGTWRITSLVINGQAVAAEDAQRLTVVNKADGTWSLFSQEMLVAQGSSTIDPADQPKTIDFTKATDSEDTGELSLGIYELGNQTRRLCFAPVGKSRPTEFTSTTDNGHTLVTFERVEP